MGELDTAEKIKLIKKQECFSQLTDSETEALSTLFIEKKVKSGDIIVTEGDPVDSVYLIVEGSALVQHGTVENGKIVYHTIAELGKEKAIGLNETGFYSLSGIRTATVSAKTDMVLLRLSVAAFHGFALTHAHVSEMMRRNSNEIFTDNTSNS